MTSIEAAMRGVIKNLTHMAERHQNKATAHDRDINATMIRRDMERGISAEFAALAYDLERDLEGELEKEKERIEAETIAAKEFAAMAAAEERQRVLEEMREKPKTQPWDEDASDYAPCPSGSPCQVASGDGWNHERHACMGLGHCRGAADQAET